MTPDMIFHFQDRDLTDMIPDDGGFSPRFSH